MWRIASVTLCPEDIVRIYLFRIKSIAANYHILNDLSCPDAAGYRGIVKNDIAALDHKWFYGLIGLLDRRSNIAIYVRQGDLSRLLQYGDRSVIKVALDHFQISNAFVFNIIP